MAWHVSNSAGILASRFHSNSFTTLPLYASEPKAAEVKAAPEERDLDPTALKTALATPEGRAELKALFESLDANGDGALSSKEWGRGVGKKWKEDAAFKELMQTYFGGATIGEVGRMFSKINAVCWQTLASFVFPLAPYRFGSRARYSGGCPGTPGQQRIRI